MKPLDILQAATSSKADVFGYADKTGRFKKGILTDRVVVSIDSTPNISMLRTIQYVIKDGEIIKKP